MLASNGDRCFSSTKRSVARLHPWSRKRVELWLKYFKISEHILLEWWLYLLARPVSFADTTLDNWIRENTSPGTEKGWCLRCLELFIIIGAGPKKILSYLGSFYLEIQLWKDVPGKPGFVREAGRLTVDEVCNQLNAKLKELEIEPDEYGFNLWYNGGNNSDEGKEFPAWH